jgi:hypothetical protein
MQPDPGGKPFGLAADAFPLYMRPGKRNCFRERFSARNASFRAASACLRDGASCLTQNISMASREKPCIRRSIVNGINIALAGRR